MNDDYLQQSFQLFGMMLFLTIIYIMQDTVNAEPSPVSLDQANVKPLSNEISTDVGAATEAGPGGDSSPQNQGDS